MNEQGNTLLHALTSNLGWPAKSVAVKRCSAQMRSTGTFGDAKLQEEVSGRDAQHGEGEGRDVMGEFIKMAGDARIHRWTDEQVDPLNLFSAFRAYPSCEGIALFRSDCYNCCKV